MHEDEDVSARGATGRTGPFRLLRRQGGLRKSPGGEYLPDFHEPPAIGRREQSVIPDFDKTIGQDVLEKTADELLGRDGREPDLIGRRLLVGESDQAIVEFDDPPVADGDAKDVGCEILEGGLAGADSLAVDDPILAPDGGVDQGEEIGLLEQVAELGAEENREWLDVDEEVAARPEPGSIG